jgi:hypothetical protein
VFSSTNSKSDLTFYTTLRSVFPQRSIPLIYCFIEFISFVRSLYVLNKSKSCWTMARKWKATSAFCVTDSLFLDILSIWKFWLLAQNISSHPSCFAQKSRFLTLLCSQRLVPHNLLSFGSLGMKINKSNSIVFAAQSNYKSQTQESITILKTRQNETTITISQVDTK